MRGDRAFTRLMRQLPESAREEVVADLDAAGDQILAAQRASAPGRRLPAALSKRVYRRTLRLRVGLLGRAVNRRLFFAAIVHGGRKAQTVQARRSTRSGKISSYQLRVRAKAPQPFVFSERVRAIRNTLGGRIRTFWERTLARAARGVGDA